MPLEPSKSACREKSQTFWASGATILLEEVEVPQGCVGEPAKGYLQAEFGLQAKLKLVQSSGNSVEGDRWTDVLEQVRHKMTSDVFSQRDTSQCSIGIGKFEHQIYI